jgi:hypothetical protein
MAKKKVLGNGPRTIRYFCCILSDARSAQPDLGHHRHVDEQLITEILKRHVIIRFVGSAADVVLL